MRLEYSDIAQTVHDYLLWSRDYDAFFESVRINGN